MPEEEEEEPEELQQLPEDEEDLLGCPLKYAGGYYCDKSCM